MQATEALMASRSDAEMAQAAAQAASLASPTLEGASAQAAGPCLSRQESRLGTLITAETPTVKVRDDQEYEGAVNLSWCAQRVEKNALV